MTGTALQADSLDSLGDAGVYALSLFVVGRSLQWRAGAAVIKGAIQGLFGLAVLAEVARKALLGAAPDAPIMAVVAAIAFVALLFLHTSLLCCEPRSVNFFNQRRLLRSRVRHRRLAHEPTRVGRFRTRVVAGQCRRNDGALDRAHILGQRSTRLHVRSDLGMLGIARQRRLNCRQSSTRTEAELELVRLRTATLDWYQCCPSVHP